MDGEHLTILLRLVYAMLAGAVIGLERTFHGRPAGFRTHTLVCTASSLLMLLVVFQWELIADKAALETVRVDPTRMAQGIMTGIGFLGAGVIMKETFSIRGLTTAGSIWITAAIGILIGMGFYFPAVVATLITLGTLGVFRWIEDSMPVVRYARLVVRFRREEAIEEDALRALLTQHGLRGGNATYVLNSEGRMVEYQLTIRTGDRKNFSRLAKVMDEMPRVHEFSIAPIGD